jgi:peptidase E
MKKVILFSNPIVVPKIEKLLFPKSFKKIVFGYMPPDGSDPENEEFFPFWKDLCRKHKAEFLFIDNSNIKNPRKEIEKIKRANSLMLTGGNTFVLLNNLRQTGLDQAIKEYVQKSDFVLSGFSAGVLVLTPTIEVASGDWNHGPDDNFLKLKDFTGLNIVEYEVLPHYKDPEDNDLLKKYRKRKPYPVKTIGDDEFIEINKRELMLTIDNMVNIC